MSLRSVRAKFAASGADPLFAPFDAADCPKRSSTDAEPAYSLILSRATIRIPRPWPPRTDEGGPQTVEFDLAITAEDDPTGCSRDPDHGLDAGLISVYRRPPSAVQMNFKTLRADASGPPLDGSLMWDGRFSSLERQVIDAASSHIPGVRDLTTKQVAEIVAFQTGTFAAQLIDAEIGRLDGDGALGGPAYFASQIPLPAGGVTFTEYDRWSNRGGKRASIARGQALFDTRRFAASNVDGFNDEPGVGNPATFTTCSTCHNIASSGADFFANPQRNIGVGGTAVASGGPAATKDLPRFTLTCHADARPGFQGLGPIVTNDPGLALVTGKCADIGRFTVPQLRALAAREPYFHDGSAKSLAEVVTFYNRRFGIGLTSEEQRDLVNFLAAL